MNRSPRECIEAVLANLEMAQQAYAKSGKKYFVTHHVGASAALSEAIEIIRTECASFLTTEQKDKQ